MITEEIKKEAIRRLEARIQNNMIEALIAKIGSDDYNFYTKRVEELKAELARVKAS